jgi:hypothetical protein
MIILYVDHNIWNYMYFIFLLFSHALSLLTQSSHPPHSIYKRTQVDHNIWNYMYFIFLLWEQDKDDDDGLEQYVRRAINKSEIVW